MIAACLEYSMPYLQLVMTKLKHFKPMDIPYEHFDVNGVPMSLLTGNNKDHFTAPKPTLSTMFSSSFQLSS